MTTNSNKYNTKKRIIAILYALMILILTHLPEDNMPIELGEYYWGSIGLDKLTHIGVYGLMAWLFMWSVSKPLAIKGQLLILAGIIVLSGVDEYTQRYVGRYCCVLDWVANALGAAFGFVAYKLLSPKSVKSTGS